MTLASTFRRRLRLRLVGGDCLDDPDLLQRCDTAMLLFRRRGSNERREHRKSLPFILAPKLLTIPPLLLPRPYRHLAHRNHSEQSSTQAPIRQPDTYPRNRLEEVVRTRHRHKAERPRYWYAAFRATLTPQAHQYQMCPEVSELSNDEKGCG